MTTRLKTYRVLVQQKTGFGRYVVDVDAIDVADAKQRAMNYCKAKQSDIVSVKKINK